MKILVCILLAGLILPGTDLKMEKIKIGKSISLDLPAGFRPLSEQELIRKYVSSQLPVACYSSPDGTADFSANIFPSGWSPEDVQLLHQFYRARILSLYDSVAFIQSDVNQISDTEFIVFEFTSALNPDQTDIMTESPISSYNYIQYAFIKGKTVVFTFSCPAARKKYWQQTAAIIMKSVKIKPTL